VGALALEVARLECSLAHGVLALGPVQRIRKCRKRRGILVKSAHGSKCGVGQELAICRGGGMWRGAANPLLHSNGQAARGLRTGLLITGKTQIQSIAWCLPGLWASCSMRGIRWVHQPLKCSAEAQETNIARRF
jgi:hypothetical protein